MEIKIIEQKISLKDLQQNAEEMFGQLVKAVVDIDRGLMAVFGELHSDEEALLLENGSKQENLWGINIYPNKAEKDRIEFDSMINLRPAQRNMSRNVDDPKIQKKILEIVNNLIEE